MRKFGFSFSWKRAFGISAAKGKVSRAIGIPLTQSGRQRKAGSVLGDLAATALIASSEETSSLPHSEQAQPNHTASSWSVLDSGTLLRVEMLNSSVSVAQTRIAGLREESLIKPGVMKWTDNDGIAALVLDGRVYSVCETWPWQSSFESLTARMKVELGIPQIASWEKQSDRSCVWEYGDILISLELEKGLASLFITLQSVALQVSKL